MAADAERLPRPAVTRGTRHRVHPRGAAVLAAAERAAQKAGRTVLVLDTASADAERLYERSGWQRVGIIPRYALLPDGPFCQTVVFYKSLEPA